MSDDLLKYILENGIINLDTIQEQMDMRRREELLKKHPYKIWEGKDGYWHTYISKSSGGRTSIKKKNLSDIEDLVLSYYESSFENRFNAWKERQQICGVSDNTIYKYECDYRRFLKGDQFENLDIRNINDEDIYKFFNRLLENKEVSYKALKALYGYINGVFKKSIVDKIVKDNPCLYVDLQVFKKKCHESERKTAEERTLSNKEKKVLLNKTHNTKSPARFAVEFSLYTGMRVGELSALMWSDIDYENGVVNVVRSEKYNRKKKEYYIDSTKNDKKRKIPLTEPMKDVLKRTKTEEIKLGYISEYVFCNQDGRIHAPVISDYVRNNTSQGDFVNTKSIHAIRRTLNSNLKCNGVSTTVASSILGHTEKVNEENYTYDVSTMSEKKRYVELAGQII